MCWFDRGWRSRGCIFIMAGRMGWVWVQVDWAQLEDTDGRTYKIAVEKSTHLPVRFVILTRNPQTNDQIEDVTRFSNWHVQDGIETAFQVSRTRDGQRITQVFYDGCKYNTGLSADFFTREA